MKEILTIKGYWFLPSNPENRIGGTLHYLPNDRMYLELIGSFETPMQYLKSSVEKHSKQQQVIFGEGENAKKITLFNCHRYGSYNFGSSFAMTSYTVNSMIVGIHLTSYEKKSFHSISARFPLLTEWINHYAINYSLTFDDDKPTAFQVGYDIENHHSVKAHLDNNMLIEINYGCSGPDDIYQEQIKISQNYNLELKSTTARSISEFLSSIYRFKSFLSMASQTEIDFQEITLFSKKLYYERKNKQKVLDSLKFFFIQEPIIQPTKKHYRKFLFQHVDISIDFQMIINRWYSFDSQMLPIINHLVESIRIKPTFRSGDFLLVVQALEGFHTRFRKISKVNPKIKISLLDRLNALKKEFSYVTAIKKAKIDMRTAADTRHYYSHFFFKTPKNRVVEGKKLYDLTIDLKKILVCCVMAETGISKQVIIDSFR